MKKKPKEEVVSNKNLFSQLKNMKYELDQYTLKNFKRQNPFTENLVDWKDKGKLLGFDNVSIYDSTTIVGDVSIGKNTWIGPFCSIDGTGGLNIGEYCSISSGTQIQTHDTAKWALSGGKAEYEYERVKIGNYCFIGVQAIILKGVTLGNHCLVGANSLINHSFDDNSIIVGTPGRKIGIVVIEEENVDFVYYDAK